MGAQLDQGADAGVGTLVELRRRQGRLAEAEQGLGSLVADARAGLGPQHQKTLIAEAIAARLQHVDEWRGIARDLRPSLVDMGLSADEQRLLGPDGLAPLSLADGNAGRCVGRQRSARSTAPACGAFGGLADGEALRQCRCFLRGLSRDKLSTPAALLRRHRCTRAPVARTSSMMVFKAMVSAATGTPERPRRVATGPLAATPLPRRFRHIRR